MIHQRAGFFVHLATFGVFNAKRLHRRDDDRRFGIKRRSLNIERIRQYRER